MNNMTTTMNLRDVALLLTNKNREYETAHSRVVRMLGLDIDSTTLNTYLDMIYNDPAEWLSLCTQDNTKPKSAIFYLLERCPEVKDEIGAERCSIVANAVRGEWKTIRKQNKIALATPPPTSSDGCDDETTNADTNNAKLLMYIDILHELIEHLTNDSDVKWQKTMKLCLPAMANAYGVPVKKNDDA